MLGKAIRVPGACGFPGMILIALTGVGGITDVWTFGHKIRLLRFVRSRHACLCHARVAGTTLTNQHTNCSSASGFRIVCPDFTDALRLRRQSCNHRWRRPRTSFRGLFSPARLRVARGLIMCSRATRASYRSAKFSCAIKLRPSSFMLEWTACPQCSRTSQTKTASSCGSDQTHRNALPLPVA